MNSSKMISSESPMIVLPLLAVEIGLNEAIMVQQINYWISIYEGNSEKYKKTHFHNNKFWIYNTYEDWAKQFPFWSISTIRRTLSNLEKLELIETGNFNKFKGDKTKWYSVNHRKIEELEIKNESMEKPQHTYQIEQAYCHFDNSQCSDCTEGLSNLSSGTDQFEQSNTIILPQENTTDISSENSSFSLEEEKENNKYEIEDSAVSLKNIINTYKDSLYESRSISKAEKSILKQWTNTFREDLIIKAIEYSRLHGGDKGICYINTLLSDWDKRGLKNCTQVDNYLNSRLIKRQVKEVVHKPYRAFCDFEQRAYNFKDLENRLLSLSMG
jgi:DNA replication protein DnaD